MTEAAPDPRTTIKWSQSDDAFVVWLLLCCPFSEFQRTIPMLSNKRPEAIVSRFLEIINNPDLIARVNSECRNDIIGYKPIPWTRHENLSLIRLVHNNRKCNHSQFLLKYPMLFHPSRTASSLNATFVRLKSKDHSTISEQHNQFNASVEKIRDECQGLNLLPFPGIFDIGNSSTNDNKSDQSAYLESINNGSANPEDEAYRNTIKGEIEKLLAFPTKEKDDEPQPDFSIETMRAKAYEKMNKRSFAALVTSGSVKLVEKCRTVFGRASPKCTPDVDLAEFNLQSISRIHCAISIATDLSFYAECIGSTVIVNGVSFSKGKFIKLNDGDMIDIGGAPFVFFENRELMNNLRNTRT
ncbi:FHA domain containing protein [Tritrichomonas foetus]|uniref:FHA domain containing protein n=1 Tax=Tritrichomonas foetus TaxID=1144522 RepID=A0A1J4JUL8_9EUKA|nr:FHA domain containing protein [Tritrichomonas foetus]|eukprot:OHT01214.1 FHA domain containing protein [Tritrichomonas foetus]